MQRRNIVWQFLILVFLNSILFSQTLFAFQTQKNNDEKFAQILEKVQKKLDELHNLLNFPGATIGFVLPDGHSGSVSTGVANLENKTVLKPTDKILAGSIGKTFVAAETIVLVQEGKLNLDEKIEKWLGGEKWFATLPNAKDITLRMLLNHSSGIPNHVEDKKFFKDATKNTENSIKYEDLIGYVLNKKPLFAAGKGYYYADTNYILVGLIIEKVTGETLYDEITRRFLKPLKLNQTIPSNNGALLQYVNGYFQNKPVITKGKFYINPQWEWAGGGFASTAEDLARWARTLYAGEVLQETYLNEMLTSTTTGEGAGYGLGVETVQTKFGKAYGHDGEFPGFLSDMRYFPNYKIAVAAQVNSDEMPGANKFIANAVNDFAQIIIDELFGEKLSDIQKLQFQQTAENWLKLIDAGKFIESWNDISSELQSKYTKDKWEIVLQPFLKKIGKFKARKLKSIVYSQDDKITVDFTSSFTKLSAATETIILKLEKDGKWHIASYSIN